MGSIRTALRDAQPPVSLSRAWRTLLQALRADKRAGGPTPHLHKRAHIERFLDGAVPSGFDVPHLKASLAELMQATSDAARVRAARLIDAQVAAVSPSVRAAPVTVQVAGWPPGFTVAEQTSFIGSEAGLTSIAPTAAARLIRDISGVSLAGYRLQAKALVDPGEILPPVPRAARARRPIQGRTGWLPNTDETGRFSASSPEMARQSVAAMDGIACVVDAFCGCGGDAIAFARAGKKVIAIEQDPHRVRMASDNARALGVAEGIEVRPGDASVWLPKLAASHPFAGLYLDPPWGGPGFVQDAMTWQDIVPEAVQSCAFAFQRVVLKAPRSFDIRSLPSEGAPWSVEYHFRSGVRPPDTVAGIWLISGLPT